MGEWFVWTSLNLIGAYNLKLLSNTLKQIIIQQYTLENLTLFLLVLHFDSACNQFSFTLLHWRLMLHEECFGPTFVDFFYKHNLLLQSFGLFAIAIKPRKHIKILTFYVKSATWLRVLH